MMMMRNARMTYSLLEQTVFEMYLLSRQPARRVCQGRNCECCRCGTQ